MNRFALTPPSASTLAPQTDALFDALLIVSVVIVVLVLALILTFATRYRRGSAARRGALPAPMQREFEIGWTLATLFAFLFFFWWAGSSELGSLIAPKSAMEIHVVAKQWMWKAQHGDGLREINTLHVPIGEPVRLVMISQDVIHSLFVPAFRIKRDILPGRYDEIWFEATKTGRFPMLCTQYCGAEHSAMTGDVIVMSKPDFAAWLSTPSSGSDVAADGERLFKSLGCAGCHAAGSTVRAPKLAGAYGSTVALAGGGQATVDDAFVREMLREPQAHALAGYPAIMPSYKDAVDDGDVVSLTAYLKSLPASRAAGAQP